MIFSSLLLRTLVVADARCWHPHPPPPQSLMTQSWGFRSTSSSLTRSRPRVTSMHSWRRSVRVGVGWVKQDAPSLHLGRRPCQSCMGSGSVVACHPRTTSHPHLRLPPLRAVTE
ncbi:hypothetical protein GGS23DRAFT_281201 [Durotheca rogersii]|uniref:uncharacterized protein n=1 Tax=Durotheca rogersii TaxID=419775 RepID=UPI00221E7E30|nr:uncharacterized protein GGS23DRAFT_281201 [Durotheca rogersii]KAI5866651.1 hypothetical protein GGS23DRAFT_281201 [Durotheca rogersii]